MFGVSGLRYRLLLPPGSAGGASRRAAIGYGLWSLCWVTGHVAGGGLLGAALGWLGAGLSPGGRLVGVAVLSAGCLAGGLHQLGLIRLPMPQLHRQVPRTWTLRIPWGLVALGYGLQLGCGVATRIRVATTYVVLGCALLSGSAAAGALILGAFGAARSLLPVALGPRFACPRGALSFTLKFDTHEGRVGTLNGAALLAAAVLLAGLTRHSLGL